MQISLNLNLIINEVSDSQIASPHQKLADTSVRRARLASAGPHAKPLPLPACLAMAAALEEGGKGESGVRESRQLEPQPLQISVAQTTAFHTGAQRG